MSEALVRSLAARFLTSPEALPPAPAGRAALLESLAAHASCRAFTDEVPDAATVDLIAAVALSSPSKSDLQQRDIIVVRDPEVRDTLNSTVATQPWIAGAPLMLVFCGNNRRQRQIHAWHGRPFANDHLDAPFNAAVDAGIALAWAVAAAEALGLGTCPISGLRDRAADVSRLLALPDHVFPVAGLALGYPASPPEISPRLPLAATLHRDRFSEDDVQDQITAYDGARAAVRPYSSQRYTDSFGTVEPYTWSEDKTRQYSRSERADFGAFLRAQGFRLD